jgi:hypothetical protein
MFFQFSNSPEETSKERGFDLPPLPYDPSRVPGDGAWAVPPQYNFASLVNGVSRVYQWTHDEAVKHSAANARAMLRDAVIHDALRARQRPVAQLSWHLEAVDDTDTAQQSAVKVLTDIIEYMPNRQQFLMDLLEALWFGRAAAQVKYKWDFMKGRRMVVGGHTPVMGDKLVFKWSGDVGVLVHGTWEGPSTPTPRGRAYFYDDWRRQMLVVHRHEPTDSDFFEGDLAGGINGVGIRGRIYWLWWLRSQVLAWLMDYLERVGAGGFTIYYYEAGNQASEKQVASAASQQHRNNTILFPRYKDAANGGPGIQRIEPSNGGAALLQSLVTGYFDTVIRRYILGQTLSSEAQGTGLGSGVADLQAGTQASITKYDAVGLQESLTQDFVRVLHRYNVPSNVPCPRWVFDVDQPDMEERLSAFQSAYEMGVTLDEDEVRHELGLAKPKPGAPVLAQVPPLSPTAVGNVPQGQPILGPGGPAVDQTQTGGAEAPPAGGPPQ